MIPHFRVILVEPQHPANVGACARLAANFGISDLWVIAPQCDWRSVEGRKMAVPPSHTIFDQIREGLDLTEAIHDAVAVIGFTSRTGRHRPVQCFSELPALRSIPTGPVALLFGNERTGLTKQQTAICTHLAYIPTSSFLHSINLSHAVAIVLSRLYETLAEPAKTPADRLCGSSARLATWSEREALWAHWRQALIAAGLVHAGNPERMLKRIRGLLNNVFLSHNDVQLLRGYLSKTILALNAGKNESRSSNQIESNSVDSINNICSTNQQD